MVSLSAHLLSHFLGKLSAVTQAISPAPLFYHCLQTDLQVALNNSNQDYEVHLSLSQPSHEKLSWWREHLFKWNGKPLKDKSDQVTISCVKNCTDGTWSVQEQTMYINCLEYLAAMLATKTFLKDISGYRWTVAYINNMGSTVSASWQIWWRNYRCGHSNKLTARECQTIADMESQTVHNKSDWMLCPQVFWAIMEAFGPLDVDPFASRLTHQIPCFFSWRPDPLV